MTLPASRFASHSIAPQTASACPGTFQHFLVLLTSLEICPRAGILESYWNKDGIIGRHPPAYWNTDGIISRHDSPFCRLAVVLGPRAHLRQEPRRSSGGHHRTAGAGPRGLILASAPGVSARATPFCPFLAKTGGSRWDFIAIYERTDGLYESQYRRLFY